MSFELEFKGRLSKWMRSQGKDVDRITEYRVVYDPQTQRGYFVVMFIAQDGTEKYSRLPADLEELMRVL